MSQISFRSISAFQIPINLLMQIYSLGIILAVVYGKLYPRLQQPHPLNGHSHRGCRVDGARGICTFALECRQIGGVGSGVCREGALFGTCCISPPILNPSSKYFILPGGHIFPLATRLNNEECGKSIPLGEFESRIVNGIDTKIGEFPWQASLRIVTPFPITLAWCGAIVLAPHWVLTAAHCTQGIRPRNLVVRFGGYSIFESLDPIKAIERQAVEVVIHPEFIKLSKGHDIALLKVEEPVPFTQFISPVCLPGLGIGDLTGSEAIVTGWGRGETEDNYPTFLQKAVVPILDNKKCEEIYLEEGKEIRIDSHFMCAGYQEGGTDSCQGDSGGPLQVLGKDNRWFLAGVTSSGFLCAKPNLPGLYTRASVYVPWILEHISSL